MYVLVLPLPRLDLPAPAALPPRHPPRPLPLSLTSVSHSVLHSANGEKNVLPANAIPLSDYIQTAFSLT